MSGSPDSFRATTRAATQQLSVLATWTEIVSVVRAPSPRTAATTRPLRTTSNFSSGRKKLADAFTVDVDSSTLISTSGPFVTTAFPCRTPADHASYGAPLAGALTKVRSGPRSGSQRGHDFSRFNGTGKSLP